MNRRNFMGMVGAAVAVPFVGKSVEAAPPPYGELYVREFVQETVNFGTSHPLNIIHDSNGLVLDTAGSLLWNPASGPSIHVDADGAVWANKVLVHKDVPTIDVGSGCVGSTDFDLFANCYEATL